MAFYINPAEDLKLLAESDTATFPATTGGILVEGGGTLEIKTVGGTTITLTVGAGYHPLQIIQLRTGTTATSVHGLYAHTTQSR